MVLLACVLGVAFVACSPPSRTVQLRFMLETPEGVRRLQFYVHDIVLLGSDGQSHPAQLAPHSPWQSQQVALVDLSPGTGSPTRDSIEVLAPAATYDGVRFAIGVPFAMNHSNQLTAQPPLNRGELFWSWQTGYKFLRLDLGSEQREAAFHLGSTGCSSASALRPPTQPCAQPNIVHVELKGFDPAAQAIRVRLDDIIAALSDADSIACTGDYSQPPCAKAFDATGLQPQSGVCAGSEPNVCDGQRLFFALASPPGG